MKVIEDYKSYYPNPLNLKVGDKIKLFEKDVPDKWKGWHWCKDLTGKEGWISETYFKREASDGAIIKDYLARELTVNKGDSVQLVFEDHGWSWCRKDSLEGWLPNEVLDGSMDLPIFETERLFLRGVQLTDIESYQQNFNDYEVIRHLSHAVPWPFPEDGVESFLKNVILPKQGITRWAWAIYLKDNKDEVIGVVDLWRKGCPENRGFWLARKHWGNGFMTEAVNPVMNYAFDKLGFDKLVFANAVGNNRSRRVKEKTGAKLINVLPAKFVDPIYTEHEVWELTKENWKAFN